MGKPNDQFVGSKQESHAWLDARTHGKAREYSNGCASHENDFSEKQLHFHAFPSRWVHRSWLTRDCAAVPAQSGKLAADLAALAALAEEPLAPSAVQLLQQPAALKNLRI